LEISERDLTDLALNGLCTNIKEKLEHFEFFTVNHLLQKAVAIEAHLKDSHNVYRPHRPNMHALSAIRIAQMMKIKSVALLNLFGPCKTSRSLILLSSPLTRISKRI
jgi:hypothetical protein